MIESLQRSRTAWASEMLDAEDAALPLDVVDESGVKVHLAQRGQPGNPLGGVDMEPPPRFVPRFVGNTNQPRAGSAMRTLIDRRLASPDTSIMQGGQIQQFQGSFAGVRTYPFSICHLTGSLFLVQGGQYADSILEDQVIDAEGGAGKLLLFEQGLKLVVLTIPSASSTTQVSSTDFWRWNTEGGFWEPKLYPWLAILRSGQSWKVMSVQMVEDIGNQIIQAS
jgi:hypothetical protein